MYALDLFENGEPVYSYCATSDRVRAWMNVYEYLKYRKVIDEIPDWYNTLHPRRDGLSGYETVVRDWLKKPENQHWRIQATLNNEITI